MELDIARGQVLQQEEVLRQAKKRLTELGQNLPKHNGRIENWDTDGSSRVEYQTELVADAYAKQAECLRGKAKAQRRLNAIIIDIKKGSMDETDG